MKKQICIILIVSLSFVLFGCEYNENIHLDSSNTNNENISTQLTTNNITQVAESEIDESPGVFYTLDDFKIYVKTGSRDLADYNKEKPPFHIPYNSTDEKGILYIDDFFKYDTNLLDDIKEIRFSRSASTEYIFDSGLCIAVDRGNYMTAQHGKDLLQKLEEESKTYISLEDVKKNPENKDICTAVHKVGKNYLVYDMCYNSKGDFQLCLLRIFTEQFHIDLYAVNHLLSETNTFYDILDNPINKSVSPLFEESEEREQALEKLISEFNNR